MNSQECRPLTFECFQKHIRTNYYERDAERGIPSTFLWLIEEIGELATAINTRTPYRDPENLREEFSDVIAWVFTLANLCDIDLAAAIQKKYLTGVGPVGWK